GLFFFAYRMLRIDHDAQYADVMERVLYNGAISGMSLDGTRFFYVNPLEVRPEACKCDRKYHHVKTTRQGWFKCACCPPNLARLVASVSRYVYTADPDRLNVNLYIGSEYDCTLAGESVHAALSTRYPWEGVASLQLGMAKPTAFRVALRIPGWCEHYTLRLNGEPVLFTAERGYCVLERHWQDGDELTLDMRMQPRLVMANPKVRDDAGKVALMRGPLVYCLEQADNGENLFQLRMPGAPELTPEWTDELDGLVAIRAKMVRALPQEDSDALYRPYQPLGRQAEDVRFIPYYAWANRSEGEMTVWVPVE
ncbi:MAG: glycoside hydrolase family 127 protein, partial [Eubacteriales bacterium]|nr:glycoside hydrolase family 127 protein [Eubacteriales bacterium]